MQKITIIGNLTQDPIIENGVARFGVAVNDKYRDKNGNTQENTEYFNCKMFGKASDIAENYFSKGMKIYIEGKQSTFKKDGKYFTSLNVREFEMLGKGGNGGDATARNQTTSQEQDFDDTDIPL